MKQDYDKALEKVLQNLQQYSNQGLRNTAEILYNLAMQLEQQEVLQAGNYERTEQRQGYRNGFKDKSYKTSIGELNLSVPQTRDIEFYPSCFDKGCRSDRAFMLSIAEMYVQGVSTRKISKIVEQLCGFEVSSSQVSAAAKLLDEEVEQWRTRELGSYRYLFLDARYEKIRTAGKTVSSAILTAYGVDNRGYRHILGYSAALSEAEVHWRHFLQSLVQRGLHGLELITSDNHAGLRQALTAVFPSVPWQRCQFHFMQNLVHHVPNKASVKEICGQIRAVFDAPERADADYFLRRFLEKYEKKYPDLCEWLEENIDEALTVFDFDKRLRVKLRTSNLAERVNREIKRRTKKVGIFPNKASAQRLIGALLIETDEQWQNENKRYFILDSD